MMIVISDTWLKGLVRLVIQGYEGLDTLIRATFQGPVHIVRQTIPNPDTLISRISAYHRFEGLSSIPQYRREPRRITSILGITNHITKVWGLCGYIGLVVCRK